MDLAVRASIFKWFSARVKHVEVKPEEKTHDIWKWTSKTFEEVPEKRTSSRLNKKKK
jgi:hypothetical protein